ncbi:MAG: hypothetical protein ACYTGJ_05000 [Planctomycetota bacterium]
MGTFHDDLGELHGITIVLDTVDTRTIIGRCHEENDVHVVLHDADIHDSASDDAPVEEYLSRAVKFGHWARHSTLVIPREQVTTIRRLGELA